MIASAQIAIYPLRQEHLTPSIEAVRQALREHGLQPELGPMSTYVIGEDEVCSRVRAISYPSGPLGPAPRSAGFAALWAC